MIDISTRGLAGAGLILAAVALFSVGLMPVLASFNFVLALAAIVLTVGTYFIGTDVTGEVV